MFPIKRQIPRPGAPAHAKPNIEDVSPCPSASRVAIAITSAASGDRSDFVVAINLVDLETYLSINKGISENGVTDHDVEW